MRSLLVGCSLLALLAPAAQAQMSTSSGADVAPSRQESPGRYLVFFGFDRATLDAEARQVVTQAVEAYRSSGQAQVTLTGSTDTSGSPEYNQRLAERRAEAVRAELVRQGVPLASVTTISAGEDDLLVPTGDGVREARNRRVEIVMPQPAPAPMAEVAPAPAPMPAEPAPMAEPEEPDRFTFSLGPVYGHNFGESDADDDKTENDLLGAELVFNALPGFLGGLSLKQDVLWSLDGVDDGLAGRSVLSLDFAPDLGIVRPRLSLNAGGVYGEGVQDGFVAGPELALDINFPGGFTLRPKVAYDYQFRNPAWDEGILWGGLDLGIRF